jgi:hypothetical protein
MLAWGSFGWLLWRYVPPHAALFEALGTPLPQTAILVILTAMWFVRLLPFVGLLIVLLGRTLLSSLFVAAIQRHQHGAITALSIVLSLATLTGLAGSAFVVHAMRAGCSRASADLRYQQELTGLKASGLHPCSIEWP